MLVPLSSGRAAAEAVRQYSDGMTQRARLAKAAAGLALASGALPWWLRRRGLVVAAAGPAAGTLLGDHVPAALGRSDLAAAIVLGPAGPNRKPVVQLIGRDGRPVGYMKVGWNDLTRRLVRAEADTLRRLAGADPRRFTAPALLHQGEWGGLDVTVSSALPHRLWRRGRRYALPPVATSREIAALGGVEETTLGESGWWARLRSRLAPIRRVPGRTATRGRPPWTAPWNGWRDWPGPGWSSAPGMATGGRGTCGPPPGGCSSGTGSEAPTGSPSVSTCSTSATRRPSRASASHRPPPPPPPGTGPPPIWPSWDSGPGWPSCCATCTCWSGSAGPPRPRCRP